MRRNSLKPTAKITPILKIKSFLIFIFVFIAGVLLFKIYSRKQIDDFKDKIIPQAVRKVVGDEKLKITIENVRKTSGVIQFDLKLGDEDRAQRYTSYITKDGKILFTSGIKLASLPKAPQTQGQTKKSTCEDLPKAEKPNLTAFVVSNCPFGIQMQRVFKKAIEEIPALSSFLEIRYIGSVENNKITSMHGEKEAEENLRQICIREEQKEKYWPYISCYIKEGKSDDCLNFVGVNLRQLKACSGEVNRGIKYAQADFDLANKFQIGGSPTLLINGKQIVSEFDFGGRVPDTLRELLCCASQKKPEFCNKNISKKEVAVSFSKTDEATNSNSSAGGCGN